MPRSREPLTTTEFAGEPDLLVHARTMQFLRLITSAVTEGLARDLARVTVTLADGEVREIGCDYAGLIGFLYNNGFTPLRAAAAHDEARRRSFTGAEDFREGFLREGLERALGAEFSEATWSELKAEMANSLLNETRALGIQRRLYARLAELLSARQSSLFAFLTGSAAAGDLAGLHHDAASLLVQIGAFSGHRTHPCSKTRVLPQPGSGSGTRSLTTAEFNACAPEAAPDVALPVLAIRSARATASLSRALTQGYSAFFAASFPDCHARWTRSLAAMAGDGAPGQFAPVPVHPLQVDVIRATLAEPIAAGDILFPPDAAIVQRPTISLRTFMPVGRPAELQIKTTLAMLMTNDVRTVSPARTYNAPVLSDLLAQIAGDAALLGRFRPLPEPAAISWGRNPDPQSAEYQDGFNLSTTFRGNPAGQLSAGEIAIPLNTLLSASPGGEIVLAEIMREAGARDPAEALGWFGGYAEMVLEVILGALARYGIGLEAHQQNTDVIFDSAGKAVALAYRDVSDIEICEPMLLARGMDIRPTLHPFIRNLFEDMDHPLRQTMHTSLVSHLFPVVGVIAAAFAMPPEPLLVVIRDRTVAVLDMARREVWHHGDAGGFRAALHAVEQRILRGPIETKCLLRKRVAPAQDVAFTTIANPLARL